jgi:para-nitrobenzyl esterase
MERMTVDVMAADRSVRGVLLSPGVAEFRGLAYASRPHGWEPTRLLTIGDFPAPGLGSVVGATTFGPVPPQPGAAEGETGPGSYLTLNVRAPWPIERPRPVLVWLCVGGNIVGRNDLPPYTRSTLAESGAVLVTVTSRLGPAGFAVVDDAADNRAVMDWIAALNWVRMHIAAFGGDPDAVTVGGQSAGGGAVTAMLASTRTVGLFHRAIIMSSALPSTTRRPAELATAEFARRLGVPPSAEAIQSVPYDRLIAQVAETFGPAWRVDDPVVRVRNMRAGPPFRIVDDSALDLGRVLPALTAGAGEHVPVLIGSTAEEFTEAFDMLSGQLDNVALADAFDEIAHDGARLLRAYRRRMPEARPGAVLGQAFTDAIFRRTPIRVATARAGAPAPTFLYETGPFFGVGSPAAPSAKHGVDVAAALSANSTAANSTAVDSTDADSTDATSTNGMPFWIARQIAEAWAGFVVAGSPGWQPWNGGAVVRRFRAGPAFDDGELERIDAEWASL